MKVQVNNKEVELTTGNTISALAAQLDLPPQGVAIALNNRMIPVVNGQNKKYKTEIVWLS